MKTSQIFLFALIGINLTLKSQSIPVTGDGYHYYGPNSTWNEYLKVGGHERGTNRASIVATNGNLHIDSKNGFGLYLNHYSQGKTLINPQGGNVGIGTTNPVSNLHLVEDGDVVYLRGNSFRTSSGGFGILGYGARGSESSPSTLAAGDNTLWVRGFGFDGTNYHRVAHIGFNAENVAAGSVPGYIAFQTNAGGGITNLVERMRISSNGNVGIGTTDPGTFKLAVNGNVRAKEIKVETGWSDFVFEEDYKLPSLEEVEEHIQDRGHLKDIPSAEEVAENGILLGEMDSKLLQKIEELTLYTIAQEKRIKHLEKENETLKLITERVAKIEALVKAE